MIHKAKDLSPDQKMAIESLLGRSVAEDEAISVRTMASVSAPEWLQKSWESTKRLGLDRLSMEEIDAEIDAARKARRNRQQPLEQGFGLSSTPTSGFPPCGVRKDRLRRYFGGPSWSRTRSFAGVGIFIRSMKKSFAAPGSIAVTAKSKQRFAPFVIRASGLSPPRRCAPVLIPMMTFSWNVHRLRMRIIWGPATGKISPLHGPARRSGPLASFSMPWYEWDACSRGDGWQCRIPMPKKVTHADAQLILQLYDLRREAEIRKARNGVATQFWPQSADDYIKVASAVGTPENAGLRQVTSYWDMVAAFVLHGALNEELFFAPGVGNEMLFVFGKVHPFLKEIVAGEKVN